MPQRKWTIVLTERELRIVLAALDLERAAATMGHRAEVDKLYLKLRSL